LSPAHKHLRTHLRLQPSQIRRGCIQKNTQ